MNFLKKLFGNKTFQDLIFIFILSLTPLLWFRGGAIMVGHDNVFPLNPIFFLQGRLSAWIEQGFGQSQSLIMGTIPIHFIDFLPYWFGLSLQTTQKFVYIFWFFSMGVSAYVLASVLNKESRIFKLTATVFYTYNFFILQAWWVAERTKFSAYIAFPLILAIYFKVKRQEIGVFKAAILNSIILFFFNGGGLYGIPLFGGFFVCLGVFILFYGVLSVARKEFLVLKKILAVTVLTIVGYILINSYYVFPALSQAASQYTSGLSKSGGVSGLIDWASEISANASYMNIFRLQGIAEWYDNPQHPYAKYFLTNPLLIAISFLWPLFMILTLHIYRKKDKLETILYLFLCFLFGVFFTAGTHPPLGFIYEGLMKYIPGSAGFRSPYYKFAPAIFLSSSLLIAYFIDYFKGKMRRVIFVVFILLILGYHFPYFTGNFFAWRTGFSTRVEIPKYVFDFGTWLNSEKKGDGRVLVVPPNDPNFQYSRYAWGYLSFQSIPTLYSNKSVVVNNDRLSDEEKKLLLALYEAMNTDDRGSVMKLMSLLRISYIVLQNDQYTDQNSTDFINVNIYKKFLTNNDSFSKTHTFGKWDLYENMLQNSSKIFITDPMYSLNSDSADINKYTPFFSSASNFFVRDNVGNASATSFLNSTSNYFMNPACINCFHKNNPVVNFPDRNILPDSPFYEAVLFYEKLTIKNSDPKTNIYNSIGLSLKRVSEINQEIVEGKALSKNFVDKYIGLLKLINVNFSKLPTLKDKFEVARDVNYYLGEEQNLLYPNLGTYVRGGSQTNILGYAFEGIANAEKNIEPYLSKENDLNNRLYEFSVDNPNNFIMYLSREELKSIVGDEFVIRAVIDNKYEREITISPSIEDKPWYSFDQIYLQKGIHTVLITFPEVANVTRPFKQENTDFSKNNVCFTSGIDYFDSNKDYKMNMTYLNDFSDNLLVFFWDVKNNGEKLLIDVTKLKRSQGKSNFEYFFNKTSQLTNALVGICAPNLKKDDIEKKFSLNMEELIYPNILFVRQPTREEKVSEVSYRQLSSTRYEITLNYLAESNPAILIFSEGFDDGWQLKGIEARHFIANGYANGWVIKNPTDTKITLEYIPNKYFKLGAIVSAIAVVLGLMYVSHRLFKKKYDK